MSIAMDSKNGADKRLEDVELMTEKGEFFKERVNKEKEIDF